MADETVDKATGLAGRVIKGGITTGKWVLGLGAAFGIVAVMTGGSSVLAAAAASKGGIGITDMLLSNPLEGVVESAKHLSDAATWVSMKLAGATAPTPAIG